MKENGTWVPDGNIKGPQGSTGPTGVTGSTGPGGSPSGPPECVLTDPITGALITQIVFPTVVAGSNLHTVRLTNTGGSALNITMLNIVATVIPLGTDGNSTLSVLNTLPAILNPGGFVDIVLEFICSDADSLIELTFEWDLEFVTDPEGFCATIAVEADCPSSD